MDPTILQTSFLQAFSKSWDNRDDIFRAGFSDSKATDVIQTLFNCFWLILPMNWPSCVKLADCSLKQNHQCRRFKSNSFHYIRDTNWGCEHAHYHRYKDVYEEPELLQLFCKTSSKHKNNFSMTQVTSFSLFGMWCCSKGRKIDANPKTSQPDVLNLLSVKKYGGRTLKLSIISSLKDLMGWRSLKCSIIFFKCKLSIVWWEEGSQLFRWSSEVMSSLLKRLSLLNPR